MVNAPGKRNFGVWHGRNLRRVNNNPMQNSAFKVLHIAAAAPVIAVFSFGTAAQEKPAPASERPACNTLKVERDCLARTDCSWLDETKDAKGRVKRRAYCRSTPKPMKGGGKAKASS